MLVDVLKSNKTIRVFTIEECKRIIDKSDKNGAANHLTDAIALYNYLKDVFRLQNSEAGVATAFADACIQDIIERVELNGFYISVRGHGYTCDAKIMDQSDRVAM